MSPLGISRVLALAMVVGITPALGQDAPPAPARADSAAIVLDVARQADREGRKDLAQYLLRLITDRFPGTPAADTAHTEVQLLQRATSRQSGTATLAAWGALYGAWLGIAVPVSLGAEGPSPIGAGILAGIPIGFFGGRAYARSAGLSAGQARAIGFASIFGSLQALGWRDVFGIGDHVETICGQFGCFESGGTSERAPFAAAIIGGLAGIGTTAVLARSREMSTGTIAAVQWGSLWGSWFGAASAILFDAQGDDAVLTWALSGSAGATIVAATQAFRWNLPTSRPWLVSAAGIAGLVTGVGADLLFQIDDEQSVILPPLAGSIAGLIVGIHATRPRAGAGLGLRESDSGSLVEWGPGGLAFGTPVLTPVAQRVPTRSGGVAWRPAVRIPLFTLRLP